MSALLGGNDPRARKIECLTNEERVTCQFKISDSAYVMTQGKTLTAPAKSAWIIAQSNDALQAVSVLLNWSIFTVSARSTAQAWPHNRTRLSLER